MVEEFSYKGFARLRALSVQAGGGIGLLAVTASSIWLLILIALGGPEYSGGACHVGWWLVVGWAVGLTLLNSYPTVWLGDQGLVVSTFPLGRVSVSWIDVVDVGAGYVPSGGVLVRTRRLTPFHRVYGVLYSRTLLPSFAIRRGMDGRERLICEIRRRIQSASSR
jgi:hypothetical protein